MTLQHCEANKKSAPTLKAPETITHIGGRDLKSFNQAFTHGLAGEDIVIGALTARGHDIRRASEEEDILGDIDIYLDGVPTSIKRQDAGVAYQNYGFELEAQETGTGRWRESWYYTGKAEQYLILQGTRLARIGKKTVQDYIRANQWPKTRTLSPKVKATQGGSYRFSDALCGFLDWGTVEDQIWHLDPTEVQ